MKIQKFIELGELGFDVSFNYKDLFYTISITDDDELKNME